MPVPEPTGMTEEYGTGIIAGMIVAFNLHTHAGTLFTNTTNAVLHETEAVNKTVQLLYSSWLLLASIHWVRRAYRQSTYHTLDSH